jgi:hypothetical protein
MLYGNPDAIGDPHRFLLLVLRHLMLMPDGGPAAMLESLGMETFQPMAHIHPHVIFVL